MTDRSRKLGGGFLKIASLAVLGAGVILGGCNNKIKEENEALSKENVELREKMTSAETQKQGLEQRVQAQQSEIVTLRTETSAARNTQAFQQPFVDNTEPRASGKARGGGNTDNSRTIEISSDVLFGPGSATLKPESKRELDKVAAQLKSARSITIEGYTDSDPIKRSHWKNNEALSKARADAVKEYLASKGVGKGRIVAVGKGSSDPRPTKKESRRVDIVVAE